ncbi:MAG: DHH family phosphoesterase [Candidatus Erginobacter occultus]|nr:DHH family phosphoesterase [Candidatus Erginobacter occultus]
MAKNNKLNELLKVCEPKSSLLILPHNHPDPDSLASGWALQYLLEQKSGIASTVAYGGILGREENRTFKSQLKIKAVGLRSSHFKKYSSVALVDCQPRGGNVSLPPEVDPLIVIDHHPRLKTTKAPFTDIQPDCGATATILIEYLREAGIAPPTLLATALYYALISETQHLGRDVTDRDIQASTFLFPLARHRLISRIEHPAQNREYFQQLHRALGQTFTYKTFIGARLDDVYYPSFVAQLADFLVSLRRATWCFVTGRYRDSLHISLRTTHPRARAGKLLRKVIGKRGNAGGHEMIAGGQVELAGMSTEERNGLEETLFKRIYKELGLPEDLSPTPLIERSED